MDICIVVVDKIIPNIKELPPSECVERGSIYLPADIDVHGSGEPARGRHDGDPVPWHRASCPRLPLDRVHCQPAHPFFRQLPPPLLSHGELEPHMLPGLPPLH